MTRPLPRGHVWADCPKDRDGNAFSERCIKCNWARIAEDSSFNGPRWAYYVVTDDEPEHHTYRRPACRVREKTTTKPFAYNSYVVDGDEEP